MINNKIFKIKLISIISITAILIIIANIIFSYLFLSNPLQETKIVLIKRGMSINKISRLLKQESVIEHRWLFKIISKVYAYNHPLKSGEYKFTQGITPYQVLIELSQGKSILHKLYIPEGITTHEIIEIINQNPLLIGSIEQYIPEGHLMPSTYLYSYGNRKKTIIDLMLKKMSENLDKAMEELSPNSPIKNRKELLILASIIEKEAGTHDEKPIVASVFLNRLNQGMKLQSDPTVIYAITEGKEKFNRSLTKNDLQIKSPYNTYYIDSLPANPICCPSYSSIMAVVRPAKTNYLFFVASGKGGHNFATTLQEHNANVAKYRAHLRQEKNSE